MRYLHLIIGAEAEEPGERRLADAVDESGRGGDWWTPARSGPVGRAREDRVLSTDGPFAETKEQLGGVMVLEAKDLNHAIQLMSNLPCMRLGGSLEIRPLNEELSG